MEILGIIILVGCAVFVLASLFTGWVLFLGGDDSQPASLVVNLWGLLLDWFHEPLDDLDSQGVRFVVFVLCLCTGGFLGFLMLFRLALTF